MEVPKSQTVNSCILVCISANLSQKLKICEQKTLVLVLFLDKVKEGIFLKAGNLICSGEKYTEF